ncbi:proton-coupled amino acid transporter-like protein CG1139 isoform X2 [Schistocerca gregaria]|uniref:proton-coupled amino acid transporter-like protein CG1139 isoform X2 n=1 Tax=Schistocerca gregaria TaxID=7010 RepID=UPI00211E7A3D|nr:proton-coupled amino acid transporter-like protein CG1139 isoform X2 [Schistocerca gregaria]
MMVLPLVNTIALSGGNRCTSADVCAVEAATCNATPSKTTEQQTADPVYESGNTEGKQTSEPGCETGDGVFKGGDASLRKAAAIPPEYDPFLVRVVDHPITNVEALVHLLKGSIGTGILATPNAFMHAGYVVGVVGTLFIGAVCSHSMQMLVRAQHELSRRRRVPSLTYQQTAMAALEEGPSCLQPLAPYAGHIVNIFQVILQIGSCCVYVVFVSSHIKAVVDQYSYVLDLRIYMLILLVPLIIINMVLNLKLLAPFTTLANILTLIGFCITFYYLLNSSPSLLDRQPFGPLKDLPLLFGTVLFSLEAIGVLLPLENSMISPGSFVGPLGVLNRAMVIIIFLFIVIGLFGYMKYGNEAQGSITLNLPADEILAQSVKIMLAVSIFISHSLQNYVNIDILWNSYLSEKFEKRPHKIIFEYIVRISLVTITFLLAAAVPNLELFISLFGSLCLSAIGIAFPAIIQSCIIWKSSSGKLKFVLRNMKNIFLVSFAFLGLVVGPYTSISDIIKNLVK